MFIARDADDMRLERKVAGGWSERDIDETLRTMHTVYERLPGDGYYVRIAGMFHLDMTDAPLPLVARLVARPRRADRRRTCACHRQRLLARVLRPGAPRPTRTLLDGSPARLPEVTFEARRR